MALSYVQTASQQRPDDPNIADTLGWIYSKKMVYFKAARLLRDAAEKLPDNPIVQYHLGMVQYKNGDGVSAKKTLESALRLNQPFPGADEAKKTLEGRGLSRPLGRGE